MGCGESSISDQEIYTPVQKTASKFQKDNFFSTISKIESKNQPINNMITQVIKNRRGKLTQQQIIRAYDKVGGDVENLFDELSQRISEYYMDLSIEAIQSMGQHKLTQVQTKVYLSQQFLLLMLDIMKIIGQKKNYEYQIDLFKIINKSQGALINYIKQKYPRAGHVFVPGDLMQIFKQFNMVQSPQNDILRNAKLCFMDSQQQQIIVKIKQFFNILIEQIDSKFPIFQSLLQQKVFTYQVDKKKKTYNYKIGRKLPQNMTKYQLSNTKQLQITSPQLFRMTIKWVIDMQQYLNAPDDEVNQKQTFKIYDGSRDELFIDQITPDQEPRLSQILKNSLKEANQPFKKSIHSLLKDMDMFNINLIKILFTTERKQKYVPTYQAHVIKYAMYNTKLVSWLMVQKLKVVLKNLISIGKSFEQTEISRKLDLIKFNVRDLLRAMVIGAKKQILDVYKNMKKLQEQGNLKIVQIKNRLGTPLNDVMIIFTIKQSFLICELQLVLSQGQGVTEKAKNIQAMNHYLYELVRSPFGVLSEVAVLLGYKDNKINYQDKISFINKSFSDFKQCQQKHFQSIIIQKVQKKPFICSQCTQFYHPFQNIFGLKSCQKCFIFQCCKCNFNNSKDLQQNQVLQRFSEQLACQISVDLNRKSIFSPLSKDLTIQDVLKVFCPKKFFFKDIFKKHYQKLKPKDIQGFIKHKQYDSQETESIRYASDIFFLIVQFKGEDTIIKCYLWNPNIEQIQNCFDPNDNFYQSEKVSSSYYDFIIFINTSLLINDFKPEQLEKQVKLCIKPQMQTQNIKKYKGIKIQAKNNQIDALLIIKTELSQLTKIQGGQNTDQDSTKKDFIYASIFEARKSLPTVGLIQQNFQMKNFGLTTNLIKQYFTKNPLALKIKTLNLNNNKIIDASVIFEECLNIENLMVSKNFITNINIIKPLKNLTKLIAFENKISLIKGFVNTPALRKLNMQKNNIKTIDLLNLNDLIQLIMSQNQFQNLVWLQKSTLMRLETLIFNNSGIQQSNNEQNKSYVFNLPKLKKISYYANPTKSLTLNCPELKFIECPNCSLTNLYISSIKIEQMNLQSNKLQNLQQILDQKMSRIVKLKANSAGIIKLFPKINAQNLEILELQSCEIQDVSNLQTSNILKLSEIHLDYNKFDRFPCLKFNNLKSLTISNIVFKNIQQVSNCTLPMLTQLYLSGDQTIQLQCPLFKFLGLKNLLIQKFKFSNMKLFATSQLPSLEKLDINNSKISKFPKLQFQKLKYFTLYYCQINDFSEFNQSKFNELETINISYLNLSDNKNQIQQAKFRKINCPNLISLLLYNCGGIKFQELLTYSLPKLQRIDINTCCFKILPIMQYPELKQLAICSSQLEDLSNLALSKLNKIQELIFRYNHINQLQKIKFPTLKKLILPNNQIGSVKYLTHDNLPALQDLQLGNNLLNQFPTLNLPKLKQISISNNPFKTLKGLHTNKLSNLEYLSLTDLRQLQKTELPVLNLPKIVTIDIINCKIQSLQNLYKSNLPNLQKLQFESLQITNLPILKLPKLNYFSYAGNIYSNGAQESGQTPKLTNCQALSKWQCPQLVNLSINSTQITQIPILNFPKLTKLILDTNKLKSITNLKKSYLPQLDELILRSNSDLKQIALPYNCVLESVDCSSNQSIQLKGLQNTKIINLHISDCKINNLGKINFSIMENLYGDQNQIQDLNSLLQAAKLKYIQLTHNKIKSLPNIHFQSLQTLSIQQNQLTKLCLKKQNFPTLRCIYLGNNQITQIQQISCLTLQYLYLENNKLKQVTGFKKQHNIKLSQLKLQNNQISKINYLPDISNIYLNNNKITNLNWIVNSKHENWSFLYLNQNLIEDASGLFNKNNKFKNLYYLCLDNNKIKNFNINCQFDNLGTLELRKNLIQVIDNLTDQNLPTLCYLYLQQNKINKVGPNIRLHNLSILDLTNNQLQEIKGMNCKALVQLGLESCKIKNIQWLNKIQLPALNTLKLSNNSISKLPKLQNMPSLTNIYIENNPIQNVDGFLLSKIATSSYINYTIKAELTLQIKKQIQQKISSITTNSTCTNQQMNQKAPIQQQQVQKPDAIDLQMGGDLQNQSKI